MSKPMEIITVMNQPGTPELRALVETVRPAWSSFPPHGETEKDFEGWEKLERVYSRAATEIHNGLWTLPHEN